MGSYEHAKEPQDSTKDRKFLAYLNSYLVLKVFFRVLLCWFVAGKFFFGFNMYIVCY
jgi:hypothetical protein